MAFKFHRLTIPDVVYVEPAVYRDERGFFVELYKNADFARNGVPQGFAQVNQSKSQKDVLRGLHYQLSPFAQGKLITVLSGEIFDVAVDIRRGSPHYGKWISVKLNADTKNMLYVPPGFAHGFCVLSETVEIIYFCTAIYCPEQERGIIWNDPSLAVDWPVKNPILSKKDQANKLFGEAENNFNFS